MDFDLARLGGFAPLHFDLDDAVAIGRFDLVRIDVFWKTDHAPESSSEAFLSVIRRARIEWDVALRPNGPRVINGSNTLRTLREDAALLARPCCTFIFFCNAKRRRWRGLKVPICSCTQPPADGLRFCGCGSMIIAGQFAEGG